MLYPTELRAVFVMLRLIAAGARRRHGKSLAAMARLAANHNVNRNGHPQETRIEGSQKSREKNPFSALIRSFPKAGVSRRARWP
jgi:hypothetical protein